MPAELIDINGEFDLGNQFTLSTATYLSESLDDSFRVIVKYQGQNLPTYNDHKHNIVFCTSQEIHSTPREFFRDDVPAKSQVNASPQGLNLEAGDAITVQAATGSNKIQGLISYALINRENENG